MAEKPPLVARIVPLGVAVVVIALDQWTKALVMASIPLGTVGWNWGDDFFELTHQRNTGVAFSLGTGLPEPFRSLGFILLPLVAMVVLAIFAWRDKSLTWLQRWGLGLILGGGLGNLIDRIFPPGGIKGVVDFLSFKFYGLFWMDRFATFNIADSGVTIGVGLILLSLLLGRRRK